MSLNITASIFFQIKFLKIQHILISRAWLPTFKGSWRFDEGVNFAPSAKFMTESKCGAAQADDSFLGGAAANLLLGAVEN